MGMCKFADSAPLCHTVAWMRSVSGAETRWNRYYTWSRRAGAGELCAELRHKSLSQIVLKCLLLASFGRPDILWSVNYLASAFTKWNEPCEKRLARLTSHISFTTSSRQYCHVGNTASEFSPSLFQDADLAGDLSDFKWTSGGMS